MQAEKLIQLVAEGNGNALEELYGEYSKMVFAVALSVTRRREDAEDILSETFVSVWEHATSFHGGSGKSWLCAIARNLSINLLKKRKREVELSETAATEFGVEGNAENKMILEIALSVLDDKEREVVLLHNGGYKHREIAEMVGEKLGTITWRYQNALQKMRKHLEGKV